jgi:hypothetical protein
LDYGSGEIEMSKSIAEMVGEYEVAKRWADPVGVWVIRTESGEVVGEYETWAEAVLVFEALAMTEHPFTPVSGRPDVCAVCGRLRRDH